MITPLLSPIKDASPEEIELYYKVEESMVSSGELRISQKEMYEDIDNHESIYHLKNHDHFHYFCILSALAIGALAYYNYLEAGSINIHTLGLFFATLAMLLLTWIIWHPKLKYERQSREFFRTHRRLFLFKD
ncbi:hypothetical protein [Halobacteriovorax sp. HLS]|uniref:hypothetical protein n=1 Tax=Halobacteriovorax sp. HLS TaxID=2234000 RepID=UPI000FD6E78D|nr:hypothetical protein [Halobacteriovorax sp. HLS]